MAIAARDRRLLWGRCIPEWCMPPAVMVFPQRPRQESIFYRHARGTAVAHQDNEEAGILGKR